MSASRRIHPAVTAGPHSGESVAAGSLDLPRSSAPRLLSLSPARPSPLRVHSAFLSLPFFPLLVHPSLLPSLFSFGLRTRRHWTRVCSHMAALSQSVFFFSARFARAANGSGLRGQPSVSSLLCQPSAFSLQPSPFSQPPPARPPHSICLPSASVRTIAQIVHSVHNLDGDRTTLIRRRANINGAFKSSAAAGADSRDQAATSPAPLHQLTART